MYESETCIERIETVVISEAEFNTISFEIELASSLDWLKATVLWKLEEAYLHIQWLDEQGSGLYEHFCSRLDKLCELYDDREKRIEDGRVYNELCF